MVLRSGRVKGVLTSVGEGVFSKVEVVIEVPTRPEDGRKSRGVTNPPATITPGTRSYKPYLSVR